MEDLLFAGNLNELYFAELDLILKEGTSLNDISDFTQVFFESNNISQIKNTIPLTLNVNNVVFHGRPGSRLLKTGDLITVDVCFESGKAKIDGAKSYIIGDASFKIKELLDVSRNALEEVVKIIDEGVRVSHIVGFLSDYISLRGFYLFPGGIGHGIGNELHESPFFSLTDLKDFSYILKVGDIFTLEPIVMLYKEKVETNFLGEGIADESNISSQFEVTICIRGKGDIVVLNKALIK